MRFVRDVFETFRVVARLRGAFASETVVKRKTGGTNRCRPPDEGRLWYPDQEALRRSFKSPSPPIPARRSASGAGSGTGVASTFRTDGSPLAAA